MPSFQVQVAHTLAQSEAVERLKRYVARVFEHYADQISDPQGSWIEHVLSYDFRSYGMHVKGTLEVGEQEVNVGGQIPLAAMLFKGKIEQTIRSELARVLGPRPAENS